MEVVRVNQDSSRKVRICSFLFTFVYVYEYECSVRRMVNVRIWKCVRKVMEVVRVNQDSSRKIRPCHGRKISISPSTQKRKVLHAIESVKQARRPFGGRTNTTPSFSAIMKIWEL